MLVQTFYEPGYGWRSVVYRPDYSVAYSTGSFSRKEDAQREAEQWISLQPPDPVLVAALEKALAGMPGPKVVTGPGNQVEIRAKDEPNDRFPPDLGEPVG